MILEPCKDCPDRHPICHDSCPRYAEYKRQLKAQRIYTNGNHAAERISRNDFDKEGWMGGRKRGEPISRPSARPCGMCWNTCTTKRPARGR